MLLHHIRIDACPTCQCNVVVSETIEGERDSNVYRTHCHGGYWESREFACGTRIVHEPNFRGEQQVRGECRFDPKIIRRNEARKAALEKVRSFINRTTMDKTYRQKLLDAIQYL